MSSVKPSKETRINGPKPGADHSSSSSTEVKNVWNYTSGRSPLCLLNSDVFNVAWIFVIVMELCSVDERSGDLTVVTVVTLI